MRKLLLAHYVSMVATLWMVGCAPMQEVTTAKVDASLLVKKDDAVLNLPEWRVFFPDARLQQLLTLGLEQNRDVRMALARVSEARAQYGISRADRLPSLDLGVGANRTSTPADVSPVGRRMDTTTGNVSITMPSYEFDFWGRVAHLNQAALASFLASEANVQAVKLSLMGDIVNAYYQWLEASERLTLLQSTQDNRINMRTLIQKRVSVGLSAETEYLQAQSIVEGLQRDMAEVSRQQQLASHALSVLIGSPMTALTLPRPLPLSEQMTAWSLSDALSSNLLLQRPDIKAAEQRLIASDANVSAARAAFLPRISLTGGYGTASSALTGLFATNSESWNFMPQLSLPIFNSGRTQANLDLTAARQVSAVADYEKTIQVAFREVADALVNRSSFEAQIVSQRQLLAHQRQRLGLSEKRYTQGLGSYLEVLDAQRECYTAEQQLIQILRQQQYAQVQVFKALGGGVM